MNRITPEVRSRIRAGLELDTTTLATARRRRTAVYDAITEALEDVDVLVTPTLGRTAFGLDVDNPTVDGESVHRMHGWTLTWLLNLSGHPAASIPVGFDDLAPIGMQVVGGRPSEDRKVMSASAAIEETIPWKNAYPRKRSKVTDDTSTLSRQRQETVSGGIVAVDGLNLEVEPGEIVGLIGPNGAGKTTTLNLITGFLTPNEGRISLNGTEVTGDSPDSIRRAGDRPDLSDPKPFGPALRVREPARSERLVQSN